MNQWRDILITDRDITLDPAGMPEFVVQRPSITQDIAHMILESGILIELVGERSTIKWADNMTRLESMVEDDVRIVPGTVIIDWSNRERIYIVARSTIIEGDTENVQLTMAVNDNNGGTP